MPYLMIIAVFALLGHTAAFVLDMPLMMELVDTIGNKQMRSVGDLDDYTNELFELAQIHIAKSFSAETRRYKRALDLTSVRINGTENFGFTMANPSDFGEQQLAGVTKLRVLSLPGKEYWVLGYGLQDSHVVLEKTQNQNQLKAIARFTLKGEIAELKSATASIFNETLWIAMASENELVSLVGVNLVSGVAGNHQVLVTGGPVGGLHMFTTDGNLFLAVGTNNSKPRPDLEMNSRIYKLVWPYFDWQDLDLRAKNVTDISGFNYYGNYYLVFSTINSEGSQVYRFNAKLMTLTLIYQLSNFDVYSVHYLHEAQENKHYMIINDGVEPKIYRWENERLLLWQELDKGMEVAPVDSIQTYRFSSLESIIMVAYGGKVAFYADDVYGHFNLDFVMHTNCNSIGDLAMVKMSDAYVVTYICVDGSGNTVMKAQLVDLEVIDLEEPKDEMDSLRECLNTIKEDIVSRKSSIEYLEVVVTTDLLIATDKPQTWVDEYVCSLPVTISGTLISQETVIIGDGSAQLHEETYNQFVTKTNSLENNVDSVNSGMNNVLYHSKDQIITGPIAVTSLTADKFESNTTKLTESNGTPLLSLAEVFMIDGIDQQVSSSMYIDTMKTDAFSTRDGASSATVNGILTNQLMRKSLASQEVTGKFEYEDLNVQSIEGLTTNDQSLTINGIDTNTIVMKGKNASFLDKKTFESLTVLESVDIELLNEIDLSDLAEDLVFVNSFNTQILDGRFTLQDVTVDGNVDVSLINNVDMKELNNLVVKKSGDYSLSGDVTYQSNLGVTGTLTSPKLNGIDVSNIVDLQTDHITGNYTFTNVNVDTAINSNNINGIDTNVDVVTIDADETVLGKFEHGRGDMGTIIVYVIGREATRARSVNGHQMEDFLSVTGVQTINGTYNFQGLILVDGNLAIKDGEKIDGVDVSEVNKNLVTLSDDQDIEAKTSFTGKLTLNDLVLNGNLNGWNVKDDLTRLDLSLPHTGSLTFVDKTTATSLKLSNSNLVVQSLNGLNVENAKADLVLVNEDASIAGSLKFTSSVSAKSLDVSGTVDNVDMGDLVSRSLKKNSATAQSVSGAISVNKGVDFGQNPSLGVVNGKDWTTHLAKVVPVNYNGVISGRKTFSQPLSISGNFNPTTLNGFDVAQLASRILTKGTNQNVAGKYTINGDITANNVVADQIDGVLASNLLLMDESSVVAGTVSFADNLVVGDLTSESGILDGCNLVQLNQTTVWRNVNGDVEMPFTLNVGNLLVEKDATVNDAFQAGTVSKTDVFHFLDSLVLKSTDQQISGEVEFLTDLSVSTLVTDTMDNVEVDKLYDTTVMDNEDSVINCDVTFTKLLTINQLKTNTMYGLGAQGILVDTINVTDVNEHAVHLTGGPYLITGDKTFNNGIGTGKLSVVGSLDGVPVDDLVVLSNHKRHADNLSFKAPIQIKGDLQVDGLVDNVDLEQLLSDRIKLDASETLSSSTTFGGMKVEGNLLVETIDDVKVSEIVFKSGRANQVIEGDKTFSGGLHVVGEVQSPVINGVDILHLNDNIVRQDKTATITKELVFEESVSSQAPILIQGNINGFDLSATAYENSVLQGNIRAESDRLVNLNSTLSEIHLDTKKLACGLYETFSYGEVILETKLDFSGKMSLETLNAGNNHVLVRECSDYLCMCPSRYASYYFNNGGNMYASSSVASQDSAILFSSEYENSAIYNSCNGGSSFLSMLLDDQQLSIPLGQTLGIVSDVKSFGTNRGTYFVTTGAIPDWNNAATTTINVLKLNQAPTVVWSLQTSYSASSLDLTLGDEGWLLLVANSVAANDSVDPFTAPSQLYLWSEAEEKFTLVQEYMGQHVTSGIFLKSKKYSEAFFTLTQLMAASSKVLKENLDYCTQVQVYKQGSSGYLPHESLPTYGAVAQIPLYIGDDIYLAILSDFTDTLDIYELVPAEGFRLSQKILVCKKPVDVVKIGTNENFLLVTCMDPPQMITIRVNIKGFSYRE
ncbi:uncharacterized protein LOC122267999 [Penaeus japonicus]|uniref:uncharacterized protein LOC122267999 n=1 Tax=Penaeus japonicus TaxID=27405 RepID=UPI001C714DBE|nr:uncharacterized protein LOC122267999 [Penaeus japonicus]